MSDLDIIGNILDQPIYCDGTIEYYPKIQKMYKNVGRIAMDENVFKSINGILGKKYLGVTSYKTYEYTHRDKKLILYETDSEYIKYHQLGHTIGDGLIVIYRKERIDPNKFPIINEYNDVVEKDNMTYHLKNITIESIQENTNVFYIKVVFDCNSMNKKQIMRELKGLISLLQ